MKRVILAGLVVSLAALATLLASYAINRDQEYRRLITQGEAALSHDQTFVAIEAFSGAIALKDDSMLAYLKRGQTYRRRGDLTSALRDLRTAAELDPTATRPLEQLGDVNFSRQRYARAAEYYQAYIRLDDRSPRLLYKLALARRNDSNPDAAIAALGQAVALEPKFAEAHYLLGLCFQERHRSEAALSVLRKAVQLAPALVAAREALAEVYGSIGRQREALDQLEALREIEADRAERYVAVGLAHARAGRTDLAILTLGNASERFPGQPVVYTALGRVWLQIADARDDDAALRKALDVLSVAASYPGTDSETLALLGRARLTAGDPGGAERALRQATGRLPIDASAFPTLALAAERLGHHALARDAWRRHAALSGDPGNGPPAVRIAELSLRLKEPLDAAHWFERALAASPTDMPLTAALANAQLLAGQRDAARATLDRGLARDPRHPALLGIASRLGAASSGRPR